MDKSFDYVYFVNSQGKSTVLLSPENRQYWQQGGRYGFSSPEVDNFTKKFASGMTRFFGKTLKERHCGIRMILRGSTPADCDRVFAEMLDVLLDIDGTGEGKLYIRRYDGTMVFLNCVYASGMNIVEQYKRFKKFTVEFLAADPMFYTEQVLVLNAQDNDQIYDIESYHRQSDDEVMYNFKMNINNCSNMKAWPVIFLYVNPQNIFDSEEVTKIKNLTTNKEIVFHRVQPIYSSAYSNIYIYTKPSERRIVGDVYIDSTTIKQMAVWDVLDYDRESLDFPLIQGKNVLFFENWDYDPYYAVWGNITVGFMYSGV